MPRLSVHETFPSGAISKGRCQESRHDPFSSAPASAIGGGKFANGAVTAAFTHLFNDEAHNDDDSRSTWQKIKDGVYFGTGFGEDAAQYYADITLDSNAPWYAKAGAYVGGTVSSLWMRDTYLGTATTLVPTGGAILTVEQTAAKQIGVNVSRSNFIKDRLFRWGIEARYKVGKAWVQKGFHFHVGPGEPLMSHHLPYQAKTWVNHAWGKVKSWF